MERDFDGGVGTNNVGFSKDASDNGISRCVLSTLEADTQKVIRFGLGPWHF